MEDHRRVRSQPGVRDQVAANWTDGNGNFKITTYSGLAGFTTNGPKTLQIYATDDAGAIGNVLTLKFFLNATNLPPLPPTSPPDTPSLQMRPSDDSGGVGDNITNVAAPHFDSVTPTSPGVQVELLLFDSASNSYKPFAPHAITTTSDPLTGAFSLQFPNDPASPNYDGPFPDGTYTVEVEATNALGSVFSNAVTFTLKTTKPNVPTGLHLKSGDDSGIVGDSITNVRKPHFDGTADPGSTIQLFKTAPRPRSWAPRRLTRAENSPSS